MSKKPELAFPDELDNTKPAPRQTSRQASRQPAGEIIRIPTSPSEWTRKDKNAVSGAVGMGVFMGILVWSIFAFVAMIGLSVL